MSVRVCESLLCSVMREEQQADMVDEEASALDTRLSRLVKSTSVQRVFHSSLMLTGMFTLL